MPCRSNLSASMFSSTYPRRAPASASSIGSFPPLAICCWLYTGALKEYSEKEEREYRWCCHLVALIMGRVKLGLGKDPAKSLMLEREVLHAMNHTIPQGMYTSGYLQRALVSVYCVDNEDPRSCTLQEASSLYGPSRNTISNYFKPIKAQAKGDKDKQKLLCEAMQKQAMRRKPLFTSAEAQYFFHVTAQDH
mmetsp:Transcript_35197/g.88910  ORF Transcript_35197/g.88910 Transcript_35197/m.88910 type:complete len:192 (-) Transcript_35197:265-840(-)